MRSYIFDSCGLRVELRRVFFGLASLALFSTAAELVWNRAVASAYSGERSQTQFTFMDTPTKTAAQAVAGIQAGRVYEAKSPALVQTPAGQSVYNDRRVTDLKPTGSGIMDYEVTFLEPSSTTPTEMPASLFVSQVGGDVTDKLPPVNGEAEGQTGTGHNWRAWAGAEASYAPPAPQVFTPGAGQVQTQENAVAASMPAGIPAALTESAERPAPLHIDVAPTPPPAPAPGVPAAPAPGIAGLANDFANSDSDKAAAPATTAPAPNAHPITRSPSRGGNARTATTPTQATEKAAGTDESGGLSADARQH